MINTGNTTTCILPRLPRDILSNRANVTSACAEPDTRQTVAADSLILLQRMAKKDPQEDRYTLPCVMTERLPPIKANPLWLPQRLALPMSKDLGVCYKQYPEYKNGKIVKRQKTQRQQQRRGQQHKKRLMTYSNTLLARDFKQFTSRYGSVIHTSASKSRRREMKSNTNKTLNPWERIQNASKFWRMPEVQRSQPFEKIVFIPMKPLN